MEDWLLHHTSHPLKIENLLTLLYKNGGEVSKIHYTLENVTI